MEIFDKLGDTIVNVSKDAAQKARDFSELARVRMDIRAKKEYINKLYQEIGKEYYEKHKDDETPDYEQVTLVNDAEKVLEELKQQLSQLKGAQICPNCGNNMPLYADYCSKCGTKLDIYEDEDGSQENAKDELNKTEAEPEAAAEKTEAEPEAAAEKTEAEPEATAGNTGAAILNPDTPGTESAAPGMEPEKTDAKPEENL